MKIEAILSDETIDEIAKRAASIVKQSENDKPVDPKEKFTVKEAEPLLKLKSDQIKALIKKGLIKATRPGAKWLITREEIDNYLNNGQ